MHEASEQAKWTNSVLVIHMHEVAEQATLLVLP
jgi:hypothetical protein